MSRPPYTSGDCTLALEVIREACTLPYNDRGGLDFDAVLQRRWPCLGGGGVAFSQARTVRGVRAAIRAYYEPRDHTPEPTYGGE